MAKRKEIFEEDYFSSLLEEFPKLNSFDLRKCINISLAEYLEVEHAFAVGENILIKAYNNYQTIPRNSIRKKEIKKLVEKNFVLLNALHTTEGKRGSIFQRNNNEVTFYGSLDITNEHFSLYSLYYQSQPLANIKAFIPKDKYADNIPAQLKLEKDLSSLHIDPYSMKKHEDIYMFEAEVISLELVRYELSLIFNKINNELTKKIAFNLKSVNYKERIISLEIGRNITSQMLEYINLKTQEKLFMDTVLYYKYKKGNTQK